MCATKSSEKIRTCVICERTLVGRSDKVFCDIQCKNKYHTELRKTKNRISNDTFEILTQNWVILQGLMQKGNSKMVVSKIVLERLNFNFTYATKAQRSGYSLDYFLFNFKYRFLKHNSIYIEKEKSLTVENNYLFKRWERKIDLLKLTAT